MFSKDNVFFGLGCAALSVTTIAYAAYCKRTGDAEVAAANAKANFWESMSNLAKLDKLLLESQLKEKDKEGED